jgi:hypothetical protein
VPAIVAEDLVPGGGVSEVLATGGAVLVLATVSGAFAADGRATGSGVRAVRRARDRGSGCPALKERPISGPAVYPTSAPATAPTGPRTSAPDSAPRAALPARSCACASNEIKDPASAAATTSFFMAVSLSAPPRHWIAKMRQHKGDPAAITRPSECRMI